MQGRSEVRSWIAKCALVAMLGFAFGAGAARAEPKQSVEGDAQLAQLAERVTSDCWVDVQRHRRRTEPVPSSVRAWAVESLSLAKTNDGKYGISLVPIQGRERFHVNIDPLPEQAQAMTLMSHLRKRIAQCDGSAATATQAGARERGLR